MGGAMNGRMARRDDARRGGFLTRLARDRRGNTLAMMAIALIPMTGLAGSAVDTARVYYVKVRLQQACDAGVLAGRKLMNGTDFTSDAQSQSRAFFANNFKSGMLGSETPAFTPRKTGENQVAAIATVTVPMTLTKMMGMAPIDLRVECEAKLEIPNLDIMFVLDTTGSMSDPNPGDSVTKIAALRTSVMNFYDAVEGAKKTGTQVRYGAVPYSSNVNVGMLLKPEWVADKWTYQSRVPAEKTTNTTTTTDNNVYIYTYSNWIKTGGYSTTRTFNGSPENCIAPANTETNNINWMPWQEKGDGIAIQLAVQIFNGLKYSINSSSGSCIITETLSVQYRQELTVTRIPNPNKGKSKTTSTDVYWWNYQPVEFDVRPLKGSGATMAGGMLKLPINANFTNRDVSWNSTNACIEERQTVIQTNYPSIPTNAYDLDVDMVPNPGDPATQWKPWLPTVIYARKSLTNWTDAVVKTDDQGYTNIGDYNSGYNAPCPSAATKLQSQNRATMQNYITNLKVGGFTHHDIGFVWGVRLLSPTGLFASENKSAPNGSEISRHLIFMTDGGTDTKYVSYDAYGIAAIDRRRTNGMPTDADQNTIVANRLSALCTVAKRKNITVWVIAFGTSLDAMLSNCASDGRSFQANNAAQLNNAFTNIAAQIAKLRVSR
jgi:Flp pilus assembly protein TadG